MFLFALLPIFCVWFSAYWSETETGFRGVCVCVCVSPLDGPIPAVFVWPTFLIIWGPWIGLRFLHGRFKTRSFLWSLSAHHWNSTLSVVLLNFVRNSASLPCCFSLCFLSSDFLHPSSYLKPWFQILLNTIYVYFFESRWAGISVPMGMSDISRPHCTRDFWQLGAGSRIQNAGNVKHKGKFTKHLLCSTWYANMGRRCR